MRTGLGSEATGAQPGDGVTVALNPQGAARRFPTDASRALAGERALAKARADEDLTDDEKLLAVLGALYAASGTTRRARLRA